VGRDLYEIAGMYRQVLVSIHAPAWGATDAYCADMPVIQVFQSTRPRGARRFLLRSRRLLLSCFNPRARVGRD